MKKTRKLIAGLLLISTFFANISFVDAEWIHTETKLQHKPFWLFGSKDKDFIKNTQLCNQGYSFNILDENGKKIDQYIPEDCRKTIYVDGSSNGNSNVNDLDGFMGDLFGNETSGISLEEESQVGNSGEESQVGNYGEESQVGNYGEESQIGNYGEESQIGNSGEEMDGFINDLFGGDNNLNETLDATEPEQIENQELDNQNQNNSSDGGGENMDDILNNLFGKTINERLKTAKIDKDLNLGAKDLVSAIKKFKNEKLKFKLGKINVSLLKKAPIYNSKLTSLLSRVNNNFEIDSIKNDYAKNISNLSYSLSTYVDEDISPRAKKVFRKKLINDLKTLKRKYKVLKRKDMIVARTLAAREQL